MAQIDINTAFNVSFPFTYLGSKLYGKNKRGAPYFMPVTLNDIELPNSIVSVTCKKVIVSTPLAGKAGKVVNEYIYDNAYEIMIRGIITDRDNPFPANAIGEIKDLYELNERIELQCALTDIFLQDDDNVIIKSARFPEMKGVENSQAYELQLLSDKDFELTIQ